MVIEPSSLLGLPVVQVLLSLAMSACCGAGAVIGEHVYRKYNDGYDT